MKIIITTIVLIFIGIEILPAQSSLEKIGIKKGFPNNRFTYGEISIGINDLAPVLKRNEQAYRLLKPARVNSSVATVLTYVGVPAVIWALASGDKLTEASQNRAFRPLLGIGIGSLALSIPLRIKANQQARKAVELYNSGLGSNLDGPEPFALKFALSNNGIGLTWVY